MDTQLQERNEVLVHKAFDTLFNHCDYGAAERFCSAIYMRHSAHIGPQREGLVELSKSLRPTLKYEAGVVVADGDIVVVHSRFSGFGATEELDRRGSHTHRARRPGGALERAAGPGDTSRKERIADVRQVLPRTKEWGP